MSESGPQVLRRGSTPIAPRVEDFFIPKKTRKKLIEKMKAHLKEYNKQHGEIKNLGRSLEIELNDTVYQVIALRELEYNEETTSLKEELTFLAYDKNEKSIVLGEGATGKVILAQDINDARLIAIKEQETGTTALFADLSRERKNLSKTQSLVGIATSESNTHFTAMEYHRGLTLLHVLYNFDKSKKKEDPEYYQKITDLALRRRAELVILACKALIYLHELNVVHRDIKPDNLIFIRKWNVDQLKFVDFGSAVDFDDESQKNVLKLLAGTFGYFASELLVAKDQIPPYDFACDFASLAILICEIMSPDVNYQQERLKAKGFELSSDKIRAIFHRMLLSQISPEDEPMAASKELKDSDEIEYVAPLPKAPIADRIEDKIAALAQHLYQDDPVNRANLDQLKDYVRQIEKLNNELGMMSKSVEGAQRMREYKELRRLNSQLNPDLSKSPSLASPKSDEALATSSSPGLLPSGVSPSRRKLKHADSIESLRNRSKSQLPAPLLYLSSQPPQPSDSGSDPSDSISEPDVGDLTKDFMALTLAVDELSSAPQRASRVRKKSAGPSGQLASSRKHIRRSSSTNDIDHSVVKHPDLKRAKKVHEEQPSKVSSTSTSTERLSSSSKSLDIPGLSSLLRSTSSHNDDPDSVSVSPNSSIRRIQVPRSPRKERAVLQRTTSEKVPASSSVETQAASPAKRKPSDELIKKERRIHRHVSEIFEGSAELMLLMASQMQVPEEPVPSAPVVMSGFSAPLLSASVSKAAAPGISEASAPLPSASVPGESVTRTPVAIGLSVKEKQLQVTTRLTAFENYSSRQPKPIVERSADVGDLRSKFEKFQLKNEDEEEQSSESDIVVAKRASHKSAKH